jgi:WD40 repeat protein
VLRYGTVSETALLAAAASPTTHEFATFGYDKVVRIWDADSGNLLRELTGSGEYGFGLAYSPDGTRLASTGGYHVYIWDPVKGSLVHDVVINSFGFRVVWSPDGSRLAVVGDGSSKIEFIDAAKGVLLSEETLRNPAGRILWAVAYSPDGSWLGTADGDGRVHVVDAATGDILFEDTQATRGAAWDLEFSPDGALLASCHKGGGVFVWNTSDWSVALSGNDIFTGGCTDGTFSVGSDVYFAVGADGQFYGWDMSAGGDPLVNFSAPVQLWMISVSGDGTFIVAAVDNGTAAVIGLK